MAGVHVVEHRGDLIVVHILEEMVHKIARSSTTFLERDDGIREVLSESAPNSNLEYPIRRELFLFE